MCEEPFSWNQPRVTGSAATRKHLIFRGTWFEIICLWLQTLLIGLILMCNSAFYLTNMVETEGCGRWAHKNVCSCRFCQWLKEPVNFSQRKAVVVALETSDCWLGTVAVVVFNECSGEIPTNAAGNDSTLSNKVFLFEISITCVSAVWIWMNHSWSCFIFLFLGR